VGGVDWIDLAQDRDRLRALVCMVMHLRVPYNAGNFFSSLGHFSFSGRSLLHGVSIILRSVTNSLWMVLCTCRNSDYSANEPEEKYED
jgi:hypothetical protein